MSGELTGFIAGVLAFQAVYLTAPTTPIWRLFLAAICLLIMRILP